MIRSISAAAARVAFCLLCPEFVCDAQQPPRDTSRNAAPGTATIAGTVISDELQPRPLRRTRVMLTGLAPSAGRTLITNDDGSFVFDQVPAGRHTLGALKEGYVAMNHGATRPGRPGMPIVVRDGESHRVTLRLPRGSVITGTITAADGQPIPGVRVVAMQDRYIASSGERRLSPVSMTIPATDDRGMYRIHGLPAGDYLVTASIAQGTISGDLQVVTDSDVRRALSELKAPPQPPARRSAAAASTRRSVAYAPVFFPGTSIANQATIVTVGKGEERTGVDIQLQPFPTARVEGVVNAPRPGSANVSLSPAQQPGLAPEAFRGPRRVEPDGRFSIPAVPPGRYTLVASSWVPPEKQGALPRVFSATAEVSVDGEDVSNIVLTPTLGLTISGRVVFEGAERPATELSQLSVNLPISLTGIGISVPVPFVEIDNSGAFRIEGVFPGSYRFTGTIRGLRTPVGKWWLKSIAVNGREFLDGQPDLRHSTDDAIVTFADRASTLSGVVNDAQGGIAADSWVIVFSVERAAWFHNSRRVAGVKPDAAGRYAIRNLPTGDYYITTAVDVEHGEWFDPDLLKKLAAGAMRITLDEHENKTQDLVVR
jgi:Carboxypeptidase regulatory-like domain